MKRFQRAVGVLLVLCLVVICLPVPAHAAELVASGTCGENLIWTLDSEGVLTISGTGNMEDYSSYESKPWSDYYASIQSVVILEGATTIGSWAFHGCPNLTNVKIPVSVTSMGVAAFSSCGSLEGIWADENNPNYTSDEYGVLLTKDRTRLVQVPGAMQGHYNRSYLHGKGLYYPYLLPLRRQQGRYLCRRSGAYRRRLAV